MRMCSGGGQVQGMDGDMLRAAHAIPELFGGVRMVTLARGIARATIWRHSVDRDRSWSSKSKMRSPSSVLVILYAWEYNTDLCHEIQYLSKTRARL